MKIWVAACDSSRMRIFEAARPRDGLTEIDDLIHAASRQKERELVSDRPGTGSGGQGGNHGLGDHNSQHHEEALIFAREVGDYLNRAAQNGKLDKLYLLAAPAFLGHVRKQLNGVARKLIAQEIDANLTKETPDRIRKHLPQYL